MTSGGGFTMFPTAIGHCGIAWAAEPAGTVLGSQLPEAATEGMRTRLRTRFPCAIEYRVIERGATEHGAFERGAFERGATEDRAPGGGVPVAGPPGTVPAWVREVIDAVTASLAGEDVELTGIPLDLRHVPRFHARVYELARTIRRGTTTTYGELARQLGEPGAAQAVGQALGANPFAPIVPCHRILAAGGKPGGFSAAGGIATKERILAAEGVHLTPPTLF